MRRHKYKRKHIFEDLDTPVVYDDRTSPSQTFDEAVHELEDDLIKPFLLTLTDMLVDHIDTNVSVGRTNYPIKGHRNTVFEAEIEVNGQPFLLEWRPKMQRDNLCVGMFFVEKDAELRLISKKTFGRDEQPDDAAYDWAVNYGHDSIVGVIYKELR